MIERERRSWRVAVQCGDLLLLDLLAGWLDQLPHLSVVVLAARVEDFARLCQAVEPDLVVLEADPPDGDAVALLARLRGAPGLRVVGLYRTTCPIALGRLRDAGFDHLIDNSGGLLPLSEALKQLVSDFFTPQLADSESAGMQSPTLIDQPTEVRLTRRELDVLRLIGNGLRSSQIATALGISVRTVENHKRHVFAILDVHCETHAIAEAVRVGLLPGLSPIGTPSGDQSGAVAQLTPREREILGLAAAGYTVQQTAHALGVTVKTVESLQRHLFGKLGVRSRAGAVRLTGVTGVVRLTGLTGPAVAPGSESGFSEDASAPLST